MLMRSTHGHIYLQNSFGQLEPGWGVMLEIGGELGGSFNSTDLGVWTDGSGLSPQCLPPALALSLFTPPRPFSFLSPAPGKLWGGDPCRTAGCGRVAGAGREERKERPRAMPNEAPFHLEAVSY